MPVPVQVPIVAFLSPNKADRSLTEIWSADTGSYQPLDLGVPHPNTRDYPGYKLAVQGPLPTDHRYVHRVWVNDQQAGRDWYNFALKFSAEANAFPTFVRTYREPRNSYAPKAKLQPLDAVYKLTLATPGSGYINGGFPAATFTGGGGSGAVGHAVVNQDGTIAELVIDNGGTGYTSAPTVTIADPPIGGTTATGTAYVQPQTALLIVEEANEFPTDSEFYGLYLNVTRVYETFPGPSLVSSRQDDDGQIVTITRTRKVANTFTASETLIGGVWTHVTKKETDNVNVAEEIVETRAIPGPVQTGKQDGKWGVETVTKQKIALVGAVPDEGFLVRESKVEPEPGSNLVGTKATINFPANLGSVQFPGQDYEPRLDTVIPYVDKTADLGAGIGTNRQDITPQDYHHASVRTIDPSTVDAVLTAYKFSYPGRINVDMPDILLGLTGIIEKAVGDGGESQVGSYSLTGNGSVSQGLSAVAQASASIIPEAYPSIRQFWGSNIPCIHYHFFLKNPVADSDVTTKLNAILAPNTVAAWPKFNPQTVTLTMRGGRASVQAKASSQGSFSTSGAGSSSTTGGGVGHSEELGLTVKTLRLSPTIHDEIPVSGTLTDSQDVSASASAESVGLGPAETQTTGPITVASFIDPSVIPPTLGATSWPNSGLFLYRSDPSPFRYGWIEFHTVVVNAADFPLGVYNLFLEFDLTINPGELTSGLTCDYFDLIDQNGNVVIGVHYDIGAENFVLYNPAVQVVLHRTPVASVLQHIAIALHTDGRKVTCSWKINGVAGPPLYISADQFGSYSPFATSIEIVELDFGARNSGDVNSHGMDNLRLGTTRAGQEIFGADFTVASIVPPFDSTVGSGLTVGSGFLAVFNALGNDVYAVKNLSPIAIIE